jgi:thiamine biosynthesis lipoprotein
MNAGVSLARQDGRRHWTARFAAMASPCEVLLDIDDQAQARRLAELAAAEAWRIERKFSRYRDDSVVHTINTGGGVAVTVDDETAGLLSFADRCHALSDGLFDITTGVLRRVWHFDGSDKLPTRKQVKSLLPLIGWSRVGWRPPELILPAGMEIDLGGIGKEYAVDRAAELLGRETPRGILVNFGGDIRALHPPRTGHWDIGIEDPAREHLAWRQVTLARGGLATSGDARRFLVRRGVRYSHVLNPRTGWPVRQAPRSVTVLADSSLEAGMLATLALLRGRRAEKFLQEQGVLFWCYRGGRRQAPPSTAAGPGNQTSGSALPDRR